MRRREVLGGEAELGRRRLKRALGEVAKPAALLADLHNIPFVPGERVIDTVTGQEVEVLGSGVEQLETSD